MANENDESGIEPLPDEEGEQRMRDAENEKQELEARGWVWRGAGIDKVLGHPDDPELHIWFDPYTGEQLLSPKLVQRLKDDFQRERGQGSSSC